MGECHHSLAVDHGMKCDEIASGAVWLTSCWSWMKCDEIGRKRSGVSLTRCRIKCDEIAWRKQGGTHTLLVMRWHVMRLPGRKRGQWHSLPVGHKMECDEIAWQKDRGSVTHKLLVMGWHLMRLPGTKRGGVSLTSCWLWDEMWWDGLAEKTGECQLQAVAHGMKCDEIAWQKESGSVTHSLLVIVWNVMKLHGRKKGGVSLTGCWSWCDEIALQRKGGVSLTPCWS